MNYSTAAIINQSFEWDADLYGALSAASKLAAAMKSRANRFIVALTLRKVASTLDELFRMVDNAMQGKIPADPNAEPITPQRLRATADSLGQLHRSLEYACGAMKRAGLTNGTLTAGSIKRIQARSQAILDLAYWFETLAQPEEFEAIFKRAAEERERGAFVDLAEIE